MSIGKVRTQSLPPRLAGEGSLRTETPTRKENVRSILLIDDDVVLCSLMEDFFSANDFRLDFVHEGAAGLATAFQGKHDLILLDVMLPLLDGFEVLQRLRERSAVPVIMLTARSAQEDRIAGLNIGADDYIVKPFGPHELLARARAVLRRPGRLLATKGLVIEGDIELNTKTREVRRANVPLAVTSFEFDILNLLMRSAGEVVSRDQLATVLYNREATPFERSLDVHISHLRRKLETDGRTLIRTVRGVGYFFVPANEDSE
jgi:two-component system response regulator CpxR